MSERQGVADKILSRLCEICLKSALIKFKSDFHKLLFFVDGRPGGFGGSIPELRSGRLLQQPQIALLGRFNGAASSLLQ